MISASVAAAERGGGSGGTEGAGTSGSGSGKTAGPVPGGNCGEAAGGATVGKPGGAAAAKPPDGCATDGVQPARTSTSAHPGLGRPREAVGEAKPGWREEK
ncbi:hypothetical protein SKB0092_41350 (plasmid) [Roseomonas mucosa]